MPRNTLAALLVILAALLLTLAAAELRAQESPTPTDPFGDDWKRAYDPPDDSWKKVTQELVYNNAADPETLDPATMTGVPEHTLALALYEGLTSHDPETLEPRPGVAERWEVSEDGKVYTFKIRADAKWSNGDPITAEDFRWSYYRCLRPDVLCDYSYLFYYVKGAEEYHKQVMREFKKTKTLPAYKDFGRKVGIEIVDPHTLRVTLDAPTAYFLDLCSFETYMPVHRATVEKHGDRWTRPENWVGNGPYVLAEWKPRRRIVFTPNKHYWDADYVKLQKITALPIDDLNVVFNKFIKGEVDWIKDVPTTKLDEATRNPDYFVQPYLGSYFYRVNVTKPHLKDPRVRQALSMAVNRETIVRDVTRAGQTAATWFCPAVAGYKPPKGLAYDPDGARALLGAALKDLGYASAEDFPVIGLLYNTHEDHKRVAERIAQMWRETLGVRVSLRNVEWKVYLRDVERGLYDVARAGWIGDYADPNTFLDMWVTDGGNNNTGWGNPKYDKLIRAARYELDPQKRFEIFREAEEIVIENEFPIIPIYIYVNKGMKRDTLQGWYENIRDLHPFQYMYREE